MLGREELIAAARKIWGEPTERNGDEWRFGTHGSKSIRLADLVWYDHELEVGGGVVELCARAGIGGNGTDADEGAWVTYDYRDERGGLLFQVVRKPGRVFVQRRPNGADGILGGTAVRPAAQPPGQPAGRQAGDRADPPGTRPFGPSRLSGRRRSGLRPEISQRRPTRPVEKLRTPGPARRGLGLPSPGHRQGDALRHRIASRFQEVGGGAERR